jgi:hypothetical protein
VDGIHQNGFPELVATASGIRENDKSTTGRDNEQEDLVRMEDHRSQKSFSPVWQCVSKMIYRKPASRLQDDRVAKNTEQQIILWPMVEQKLLRAVTFPGRLIYPRLPQCVIHRGWNKLYNSIPVTRVLPGTNMRTRG